MQNRFEVRLATRLAVTGLVALVALSGHAVTTEREAGACSCMGPIASMATPDRVDDAPLNAKVRVEVPTAMASGGRAPPASMTLREHATGKPVPATTTLIAPGGGLSFAELTPSALLDPATRYEVVGTDPAAFPQTTVFGTFRTGTASDKVAPRIDAMGSATAERGGRELGCSVRGPWIAIDGLRASDPDRPGAQLVYVIWLGDAGGKVDTTRPPSAMKRADGKRLTVGRTSICDPYDLALPKAPFVWLAIAAIDEAGNTSAARRVRVDLAGAKAP